MATPIIVPDPLDISNATEDGWVQEFNYEGMETVTLEEVYPNAPVFGSTESFEVAQGQIGNCGSIAEIAAYAESKTENYKLEGGIYPTTPSKTGQYWVRFAQGSKLFWVKIDSKVPSRNNKNPCYCRPKNASIGLWPSLLEKAKATVKGGSYSMLTNHPKADHKQYAKEFSGWFPVSYEKVTEYSRAKEIIERGGFSVYAFPKQVDDDGEVVGVPGLVTGHAFTSADADIAVDSEGVEHNLIHVENPWGGGKDYVNLYAQDSEFWEGVQNRDRFLSQSAPGGSWWMSWEELLDVKNTSHISFQVPMPLPDMPHIVETMYEFDGSNATKGRWPNLAWLKECEKPIRMKLGNAGKLSIKLSWTVKNKAHVYFIVSQDGKKVFRSGYGWWGGKVIGNIELEAGEYELYPATVDQHQDRGTLRALIQGSVEFEVV